jgi:hypothetical protein
MTPISEKGELFLVVPDHEVKSNDAQLLKQTAH